MPRTSFKTNRDGKRQAKAKYEAMRRRAARNLKYAPAFA